MLIEVPKAHMDPEKEIKIRIPAALHRKLHSMKVLTGKPIAEAVAEALALYFARIADEQVERHLEAQASGSAVFGNEPMEIGFIGAAP
ncbi:MAG: hypothetical protein ACYDDF_10075 [Thermoplasmatota archaeon]